MTIEQLEEEARKLGRTIAAGLPKGIGFALVLFDFGPGGSMTYLSNGQRQDMIKALRELLIHIEGH